jgi:hypothetical membrane protein
MTVTSGRLADFAVNRRMLAITALALPVGALSAGAAWCLIRLIGLVTNLVFYQRWGTRHLIAFGRRPGRAVDNPPEPSPSGPTMTISTRDPNRRRLLVTSAAAVWIAAGLGYLILEAIAAAGFRPNYSYAHNFISDLGVTSRGMFHGRMIDSPLASLMNTAFYLQGTLFLAGAVLIVRAFETHKAALFLTLAATNAVGNFLVATIHSGPIAQANGTSWVHATGAVLAILGGNAAILAGSSIVRNVSGPWYRGVSAGLALLGLLSFTLLVIGLKASTLNILPPAVWERCSVYSITAWQMFTAAYLLARPGRPV